MEKTPAIITIAGSDSIGGAGIQADIKTSCRFKVYAASVITGITAQNSLGVQAMESVSPELLRLQLKSVLDDFIPDAVKIGMIPNVEAVRIIADAVKEYGLRNIVVDPVLVSTSGRKLSDPSEDIPAALIRYLFPLSDIVTPNIPEIKCFMDKMGKDCESLGSWDNINAEKIIDCFKTRAVLLKGGHLEGDRCTDLLIESTDSDITVRQFVSKRICSKNTHGTGCSYSSAIACRLAKGLSMQDSVEEAKMFINLAIAGNKDSKLFKGNGSLDFFC